jgi:hypothetical protein
MAIENVTKKVWKTPEFIIIAINTSGPKNHTSIHENTGHQKTNLFITDGSKIGFTGTKYSAIS